ncbi:MAG: DUF134 domain-containing protein [Candidatus Omnitrophica bacterium]|nr:DUF134 domain-containing protein [Candidatus Omnitrophota bacterium]
MFPRGRPKKSRIIRDIGKISQFSPRGRPGRPDEAYLTLDMVEALRLVDFKGLSQKEAAKSMGISQQTLSRILKHGHNTVADALVNGKLIRIHGGNFEYKSE